MRLSLLSLLSVLLAGAAFAQDSVPFDSSGNGLLKGVYNFRQVVGSLNRAVSLYGTITFDGNGNYSIQGTAYDSKVSNTQPYTATGTYVISASGLGKLSSTILTNAVGIFGLVAQGVFIGSSTEDGVNDIFIAAPAAASPPTTADFKGSYWVSEMSFPTLDLSIARDAFFQLSSDGQGNLGSVSVTGYIGNGNKLSQSLPGSRYAFTNGTAALTFGGTVTAQSLIASNQTMYMSPDANIIFGGSNQGFDLFVGAKALPGNATASTYSG